MLNVRTAAFAAAFLFATAGLEASPVVFIHSNAFQPFESEWPAPGAGPHLPQSNSLEERQEPSPQSDQHPADLGAHVPEPATLVSGLIGLLLIAAGRLKKSLANR